MRYSVVKTAVIDGINVSVCDLETTILSGLPRFEMSGVPAALKLQIFSRVRAALKNSGFNLPFGRIVCQIKPPVNNHAETNLDLALAVGILLADLSISVDPGKLLLIGNLGLDGTVRAGKGIYAILNRAVAQKLRPVIISRECAAEVWDVPEQTVLGVRNLAEAVALVRGAKTDSFWLAVNRSSDKLPDELPLMFELVGQTQAKKALLTALCGWHSVLLIGVPGSGKTTLARQAAFILPPLSANSLKQLRTLYSTSDYWEEAVISGKCRPFLQPHHTVSTAALIGGGQQIRAGICTLADQGILFLDELTEFKPQVLDSLRQPLSDQRITLDRQGIRRTLPADFLLICAANPCRCGYYMSSEKTCRCDARELKQHFKRLSGPLLDRLHLLIRVEDLSTEDLIRTLDLTETNPRHVKNLRETIVRTWEIQFRRCRESGIKEQLNGKITTAKLARHFRLAGSADKQLARLGANLRLTPRSFQSLLRVSRTLADLENSELIELKHIHEAVTLRVNLPNY